MTEARNRRVQSPEEAAAAQASKRRIAAETSWNTSSTAIQAVRNHLVTVMAATR
ncbi:hypothetical protein [Catellatospora vulcania]|uniref:hypothetical protein n=1 Tax=Catellatospora vulcania TaxID=1460450 RepID=UPI0012D4B0C9|nr:hypothetical protein [Catellatospora vulcania]